MRWNAKRPLERARKVSLANTAHAGEAPDRPVLIGCSVHPVLCAQQPPHQLGILHPFFHSHEMVFAAPDGVGKGQAMSTETGTMTHRNTRGD